MPVLLVFGRGGRQLVAGVVAVAGARVILSAVERAPRRSFAVLVLNRLQRVAAVLVLVAVVASNVAAPVAAIAPPPQ